VIADLTLSVLLALSSCIVDPQLPCLEIRRIDILQVVIEESCYDFGALLDQQHDPHTELGTQADVSQDWPCAGVSSKRRGSGALDRPRSRSVRGCQT
jgi:hypothetical protein